MIPDLALEMTRMRFVAFAIDFKRDVAPVAAESKKLIPVQQDWNFILSGSEWVPDRLRSTWLTCVLNLKASVMQWRVDSGVTATRRVLR